MSYQSGRHFLQIPGPTNVPDRILRAIDRPTIDHRGPEFASMTKALLHDIRGIFKTDSRVVIHAGSGTGAWEAALVNTLSMGDRVLMYETGQFAALWRNLAERLGLAPEFIEGDWRHGVDAARIEAALAEDKTHTIKAVCVVHNDTATGITSSVEKVRQAMDAVGHPALLMVDTVSSLGAIDYKHDEWGVDVTIGGSQKGLMLPPGLSFNAISDKALAASKNGGMPRSYWDWNDMIAANEGGSFPFTPATNMLFGLREAIDMLNEEGLDNVFARHARHGEAARRAVAAWGLELQSLNPDEHSNAVTTIRMPEGNSADAFRKIVLENFNMSLGGGLAKVADKVFRIGHLGDFNDLSLTGALCGVEMGLGLAGVPHSTGGVAAAMDYLAARRQSN
ncbi:MAG: aminotransferase class V-fold PLP-dependent enzyme [Rhodospirillaceae bacterium]|jgi:alanine-glyoxylate transaminase/serine-glyoxylate transaminase/serine-pyruvate transaminase|nr:aminotransferase class V-fold PLP-dependent enzyme [Rhodospirillaceae bacterium]MBT5664051.1 aminotransferase class V-fold PLP-dependent enzyme [Rhodospirillaceae bacterium]MBT5810398.1 aminotransferase class V-fold PLP-dependent enzyme [Rhodospirillaceae bacterium]